MSKYHKQTRNMIIDPYFDGGSIFEQYPQLNIVLVPFASDLPDITWHSYFRYLALCYESMSPFCQMYPDLTMRKRYARIETGYEGEDYPVIGAEFIKKVVSVPKFQIICNLDNVFEEYTSKLAEPIDDGDPDKKLKAVQLKNTMITQQVEMVKMRDMLVREVKGGDTELPDDSFRDYTPEAIAKRKKDVSANNK